LRSALLALGFAALLALAPHPLTAQGSGIERPAPVEAAPLPPPGAPQPAPPAPSSQGSGGVTLTQEPPAPTAAPPAATPAPAPSTARPTLVPIPGDPMDVRQVTLPGKPAAVLPGESTWDDGFDNLKNAFARIEGELGRAGLRPAGRPVTVFVETDDAGFRYEAMVPLEQAPEGASFPSEMRFGRTPEGRAYHFVHKGPYENIDSTYETITAYLDAKGITAKDVFIEEYVTDLTDSHDDNLEINIFVQPR
jgi:effector-binding domain-containing protein